eukprot:CAMPEP_0117480782 /NCGR_PEP_ID=MMETSP0784-20121206/12565_1 /TAXON_ID=39447 /ORGANISM="" /LENGTH=88 /DNA_ID=CAMNT_0005275225 /DNA_START=361 /DNA_END=627 /DNA_ORIENTATION=+
MSPLPSNSIWKKMFEVVCSVRVSGLVTIKSMSPMANGIRCSVLPFRSYKKASPFAQASPSARASNTPASTNSVSMVSSVMNAHSSISG